MNYDYVQSGNIEKGNIVVYVQSYGTRSKQLGEFKGYKGNKAIIGRWEFKDQLVDKENLLGLFHCPEARVHMGVETWKLYDL